MTVPTVELPSGDELPQVGVDTSRLHDDHERLDALDRNEPVYDHPERDWTDDVWGISQ